MCYDVRPAWKKTNPSAIAKAMDSMYEPDGDADLADAKPNARSDAEPHNQSNVRPHSCPHVQPDLGSDGYTDE